MGLGALMRRICGVERGFEKLFAYPDNIHATSAAYTVLHPAHAAPACASGTWKTLHPEPVHPGPYTLHTLYPAA